MNEIPVMPDTEGKLREGLLKIQDLLIDQKRYIRAELKNKVTALINDTLATHKKLKGDTYETS